MSAEHVFTAFFPTGGLGGGALGAIEEYVYLGRDTARFVSLGSIDIDREACADFEMFTGSPAMVADLHTLTPEELLRWMVAQHGERVALRRPDFVFLSPPCLPGDGLVVTPAGPRRIDTMRAGDLVLTHRGRHRPVQEVGTHLYSGDLYSVRLNGTVDSQRYTAEHPIWRRRVVRSLGRRRALAAAEFVPASEVRVGDRVGFPVDREVVGTARAFIESLGDPCLAFRGGNAVGRYKKPRHLARLGRIVDLRPMADSSDLWFLIGAYLGDGYRRVSRYEVVFCVGPSTGACAADVRGALHRLGLDPYEDASAGPSNVKLRIHSKHLCQILGAFGDGAEWKDIPPELMGLERTLLEELVSGYKATDGSEQSRRRQGRQEFQARWKIASISLPLLRSLQRLLLRLGEFGCINVAARGGPQIILGRRVMTRPRWELVVRSDPKKRTVFEFDGDTVWVRVRTIKKQRVEHLRVWNMSVQEDDTFCSPMIATHNCKGFSGLLPEKTSHEPKYQELNSLVFKALFLVCETWNPRPPMIILENVPKIQTRGAKLLLQAVEMLRGYGYVFDRAVHDCGEIGGLAQHRKRFLLIARDPKQVPAYVYQPPKKRVRGCGEVLGDLPLPQDPSAGELHRLPRISFLNWKRLAMIEPGKDWRYLAQINRLLQPGWNPNAHRNKLAVGDWQEPAGTVTGSTRPGSGAASVADPRGLALGKTAEHADAWGGRPGLMGVLDWQEPSPPVIGRASVSGGHAAAAVADPRTNEIAVTDRANRFHDQYRVQAWEQPAAAVTGVTDVQAGAAIVADPRFRGSLNVRAWDQPTGTVTGENYPSNGGPSVADPRLPSLNISDPTRGGALGVMEWDKPARSITGSVAVSGSNTPGAVADPRLALDHEPRRGAFEVQAWDEPANTVRGRADVRTSPAAVADPRVIGYEVIDWRHEEVQLACAPRAGTYGVIDWRQAMGTVIGSARIDSGAFAVADPRPLRGLPEGWEPPAGVIPVIISPWGFWHRPVTTLELAVLQGLPWKIRGQPLRLAGNSVARWRERIGNAVPRQAGRAIAGSVLKALLASAVGGWGVMHSTDGTPIWVRQRDLRTEDELGPQEIALQ